MNAPYVPVVQL